jgi:putative transposase
VNRVSCTVYRGSRSWIVETQDLASLPSFPSCPSLPQIPSLPQTADNQFGPQSKNLASIVRGYKIGVTKYARKNNIPFQWQSRYYDHIIRDEISLNKIRQYIIQNPLNWQTDAENPAIDRKMVSML